MEKRPYHYRIRGSFIIGKTLDTSKRNVLDRVSKSFQVKKSDIEIWREE